MLKTGMLHHVSLPVSDIDKARSFYEGVLGLEEDKSRPAFDFDGAWYKLGDRRLHLIVPNERGPSHIPIGQSGRFSRRAFCDPCAQFLRSDCLFGVQGLSEDHRPNPRPTPENPRPMRVNAAGKAGFPQIYILDPDRNVIEVNAEAAD